MRLVHTLDARSLTSRGELTVGAYCHLSIFHLLTSTPLRDPTPSPPSSKRVCSVHARLSMWASAGLECHSNPAAGTITHQRQCCQQQLSAIKVNCRTCLSVCACVIARTHTHALRETGSTSSDVSQELSPDLACTFPTRGEIKSSFLRGKACSSLIRPQGCPVALMHVHAL